MIEAEGEHCGRASPMFLKWHNLHVSVRIGRDEGTRDKRQATGQG